MIITTAGHVDHGKTSLITAMTGIDTDRLPEEKARGLSIDLGFAYVTLANGARVGFVDVPGHEKFIRNMLCGVSIVDFALLIVAADDGPMPQTEEHLAIVNLLGVTQGAIALNKIDRVDDGRVAEVRAEIGDLAAGTSLADAPIFPLSAVTGEGVPALSDYLADAAAAIDRRPAEGNFRMALDRRFTVAGAGTVVTGAVFSGRVALDDRLIVSPQGTPVRVRGIHRQNISSDWAAAGDRCALNITGADLNQAELHRGDWLVAPAAHRPTHRFDAVLSVLDSEPRALDHWTPVHVHFGAGDVTGRVAVLGQHQIAPGAEGFVQVVTNRPVNPFFGDRFVLRDQSARHTIAGGRVVDPNAPRRGRATSARLDALRYLTEPVPAKALAALLQRSPHGVDAAAFARARNLTGPEQTALLAAVPHQRLAEDGMIIDPAIWQQLLDQLQAEIAAFHLAEPAHLGPTEPVLRAKLTVPVPVGLFRQALLELVRREVVVRDGLSVRLPDHQARLTEVEEALWQRVAPLLAEGGIRPPRLREVAEALAVDLTRLQQLYQRATLMGLLLPVAPNRYFPPAAVRELAAIAEGLAANNEQGFSAAEFRDASGIGRNLTIEVLEFFDRTGLTRRTQSGRHILRPAVEVFGAADGGITK